MENQGISFPQPRTLLRYHPSAFLLAAQLLSLVLYAFYDDITGGRALFAVFGVLVLVLAVWVVIRSPSARWIAWVLAAAAFTLSLLSVFYADPRLVVWSSLMEALLYFYAAGSLIAYMMEDRRVTTDELFAAGATFTLIVWGFAYIYLVCQIGAPGSFIGAIRPDEPRTFLELLFLSFTTLLSTGLGDILPVTPMARVLVMLEQFAGIAYIAVVVSRLIGMTIVHYQQSESDKGPP
ncbi:MAG: two pore domain potassium channel family protein [Gammaproteobacteria bacterium]|nr:two pore domain potassium channel family protein [Gammaproteobacteria bacterium]